VSTGSRTERASLSEGASAGAAGGPAEYDAEGAPANAAAEQELALAWGSGAKAKVVKVPFAAIERAAGGFAASSEIGGGASCRVYRGRLLGIPVAVKRLVDR
jgi:hypothetical protein